MMGSVKRRAASSWIGGTITPEARCWVAERSVPTLVVPVGSVTGLTKRMRTRLKARAATEKV
ncbi:MAG: hypothetical protein H0U16_02650 [Actinobacteria bacterium]|nr:hypothetical protein [Actinomycetota bacterium]